MLYIYNKFNKIKSEKYKELANQLPSSRKQKLNKLFFNLDKQISIVEYFLLKKKLKLKTNIDFSYNSNGKPYIENKKYFSLSHCQNMLAVGISNQPIGVDIQSISYNPNLAKLICTEDELKNINQIKNEAKAFTIIYTQKESAIKCLGLNLTKIKTILSTHNFKFKTKRKGNFIITACIQKRN